MLMTTKPMFDLAYEGGFGVGAFNVNNMEITQGIIDACAAEKSPLHPPDLQGRPQYANIRYLRDHRRLRRGIPRRAHRHPPATTATPSLVKQCIADGYTSVMIDGSHHPYEENVALTAEAVKVAHEAGVVVEAELGMLGGIEEDVVGLDAEEYQKNLHKFLTDPQEAKDFSPAPASTRWRWPSAPATARSSSSTRPSWPSTASSRS
jgi:fructose-bisphosphate aldolase, class II